MIALGLSLLLSCGGDAAVDSSDPFDPSAAAGCVATALTDEDRDGGDDARVVSTFDEGAAEVERSTDLGADGVIDEVVRWTRDASGDPLRAEVDEGDDGELDEVTAYTWEAGRLTLTEVDSDADGDVDRSEAQVWDAEGRLARVERDYGGDGQAEEVCVFTWSASTAQGVAWEGEAPCEANGRVMNVAHLWLDAEGRVVYEARDINDGDLVEESRWGYNGRGLLETTGAAETRRGVTSMDWTQTRWYSPEGLLVVGLVQHSVEDDQPSERADETRYSWACD